MFTKTVYKKDYSSINYSIVITIACILIVGVCMLLADAVSQPIMLVAGATPEQVNESLNTTLFAQHTGKILTLGPIVIFFLSYVMWRYITDGFETGFFELPYTEDTEQTLANIRRDRKKLIDSL